MIITVAEDSRLGLRDPEDFRGFEIEVADPRISVAQALAALRTLGDVAEDGHVWIGEAALVKLAGRAQDTDWLGKLAAMKDKARPYGWVDDDRHAIRAHIKWPVLETDRTS